MVVSQSDGGAGGAVIGLVDAGGRDAQGARRDIGGGARSRVKGVIGRVGSRHADAADADGLVGGDRFGGKAGTGVAGGETVTGEPVVGKSDGGAGGAVIDLVGAGGGDGQGAGGDVRHRAGRGIGRVVGGIGAGDRDTADSYRLGGAEVLIGESGGGVGGREAVAGQAVIREGYRGASGAVVSLIDTGGADQQRPGSDIGQRRRAGRSQLIVAGGGA